MGLIKEGDDIAILSDILGDEDHLGDMDFKVAGTAEGITALQMDIKIDGVTREIMRQALDQAREGRLHILEVMDRTLERGAQDDLRARAAHRHPQDPTGQDPRRHRPRRQGHPRHRRGDRRARSTSRTTARCHRLERRCRRCERAIEIIEGITAEPEVGRIYKGTVRRIVDFGAFVEILPGTDGLLHISQIGPGRVHRVSDVLKEGDEIQVKVLEIDRSGKIRLSRKEALGEEGEPSAPAEGGRPKS